MRALVLTSPGKFEIQTVAAPRAPEAGEVLCKVGAVAICGSDPEIIRGDLAGTWPPAYPFIPGHEWAGEVVAIGPGVVDLAPGDRVAGQAHCGCGTLRQLHGGALHDLRELRPAGGRPPALRLHHHRRLRAIRGAVGEEREPDAGLDELPRGRAGGYRGRGAARAGVVRRAAGRHGRGDRPRADRADRDAHGTLARGGAGDRGRTRRAAGSGAARPAPTCW